MPKGGHSAMTDGTVSPPTPIAVIEVSDDDKVIEILDDDDDEVIKVLNDDNNDVDPPGKTSNSRISHMSGAMVPGSSIYSSSSKVCLWYL
jgi:hypothetical protein